MFDDPSLLIVAQQILERAGACASGLILGLAALSKFRDLRGTEETIANYRIVPMAWTHMASIALPSVEFALSVCLLSGEDRVAPFAAAVLLLVFSYAIGLNLKRGRAHIDCGCNLGRAGQPLHWLLVVRNISLAALLCLCAISDTPISGTTTAGMAFGIALFVFYFVVNSIAAVLAGGLRRLEVRV